MEINCPGCDAKIEQHEAPTKLNSRGEAWICFKCTAVVCVWCYMHHTERAHPECYGLIKKPTVGGKKKARKR